MITARTMTAQALATALLLAIGAGAAQAEPASKWRIEFDGQAAEDGTVVLRVNPQNGRSIDVDTRVSARSSDPGLWVHAAQNGELLTVILINRSRTAKTVSTVLPKQRFTGGEYFDEKIVDEERPTGRFRSGAETVEVPGYSFVRLNFRPPLPP